MTPEDTAACLDCGHWHIQHEAIGRKPCLKSRCACRRYLPPEPDAAAVGYLSMRERAAPVARRKK